MPSVPPLIDDDDALDPSFDVEDEDEEIEDDFDQIDWPDDEEMPHNDGDDDDLQVAPTEEIDFDDIDDDGAEFDPDDDNLFSNDLNDEEEEEDLDDELPVLPWKGTATLPEHNVEIAVILDVTAPTSTWIQGPGGRTRVVLSGVVLDVDLAAEAGDSPCLRLGRDAISGRLLVKP